MANVAKLLETNVTSNHFLITDLKRPKNGKHLYLIEQKNCKADAKH